MSFIQVDANRFTQDELIEYVRMLISSGKEVDEHPITDPIALKYLKTLESDADELESTQKSIRDDEKSKMLIEADRVRDRALSVFRRLMQVYELSEDNSPEAIAYEYLDSLWRKKYDPLPFLSLSVETEGIDDLLFDLSADKYASHIKTLDLEKAVTKIRESNREFKVICGDNPEEQTMKPTYDARTLRIELTETVKLYVNYVKTLAEATDQKGIQQLYKSITATSSHFRELLAARHSGTQPDVMKA